MLQDPQSSKWNEFSIEFCGGTHLRNTRDAKKFVLFEEGAIAKGIRRISAYTGKNALQATERFAALEKELASIKLLESSELAARVTAFKPKLDASTISLIAKERLRKELDALVEIVKRFRKEAANKRVQMGVQSAIKEVEAAKSRNEAFVVSRIDIGTDTKAGKQVLDAMERVLPTGSFFVMSVDIDTGKVAAFCRVGKEHEKLDAREWMLATMKIMDGRGGGKNAQNATGQAKDVSNISQAIEHALAFIVG